MPDEIVLPQLVEAVDQDRALAEAADALSTTRRGLFGLAAGGAALGALAGATGAQASGSSEHDVKILNYALGLEYLQAAFYTEAERLGALHGALAQQARVVGAHERAHVAAFRKVLGKAAIARPTFNFQGVTQDPHAFRSTAVAFEDLAVEAYKYQLPHLHLAGLSGGGGFDPLSGGATRGLDPQIGGRSSGCDAVRSFARARQGGQARRIDALHRCPAAHES